MQNPQSGSKKRPAKTQGDKDTKKRKTTGDHDNPRPIKKRNKPITLAGDANSSSDEGEQEDNYKEENNSMDIDHDPIVKSNKPGASAFYLWLIVKKVLSDSHLAIGESHKAQKELLSQRKAAKPNAAMMDKAKPIWALARQRDIPRTEREKHVKDLTNAVTGKVQDVVFKHDGSRIIQTVSIALVASIHLQNVS